MQFFGFRNKGQPSAKDAFLAKKTIAEIKIAAKINLAEVIAIGLISFATKTPRIKLSTIHAAKGGECENVVLITDITNRVYKNYQQNPDDENRVFYVAVTRTKENLYLIEPQSPRCYQM